LHGTKVVFLVISAESLATEYLSSYLKKNGHETELIFDSQIFARGVFRTKAISNFFDVKKELAKEIISKKPDLIGISVFSANYQRALTISRELKKISPKTPIIFGGIHPTSVPEVVIKEKCVDMVCVGEGEEAMLELLDSYKNNQVDTSIRNIWFKNAKHIIKNQVRPLISNLDNLPFPDKNAFYQTQPKNMKDEYCCISSRGCPFACSYCGNSV